MKQNSRFYNLSVFTALKTTTVLCDEHTIQYLKTDETHVRSLFISFYCIITSVIAEIRLYIHSRLRLKCSTSKHHLFSRNLVYNAICTHAVNPKPTNTIFSNAPVCNATMFHVDTLPFNTGVNILLYWDKNLSLAYNKTMI